VTKHIPHRDHIVRNRARWDTTSDEYEVAHGAQLAQDPMKWGVWGIRESELDVLGEVERRDVLELGCGAARWSIELSRRGARTIGLDLSARQLAHARRETAETGVRVPLVHGNAEELPFADQAFDIVFCDHGATTFADPQALVPEVARVLRAAGIFAFCMSSPLRDLCYDLGTDSFSNQLVTDYDQLRRVEYDDEVNFQLPYGDWIRLFHDNGLVVEALIELRAPDDAQTTYVDFIPYEWARRWPAENIWKTRKRL
jgi:SAM-dependent methyltransferase